MSERYEGRLFTRHVTRCSQCPDYRRKRQYCTREHRDVPPYDPHQPTPDWCPLALEVPWLDRLEQCKLQARLEKAEAEVERLRRVVPVLRQRPDSDYLDPEWEHWCDRVDEWLDSLEVSE